MPHRLDHLIDQLFTEESDRTLARAWAAKLDADGVGDRAEALIREAALTTTKIGGQVITPQQAVDYLSDFARTIGVLDHQVASSVGWLAAGGPDTAAASTDHYEIERRIAKQDAEKYERMMREDPRKYWGSPDIQQKYRDALERSTAAPPLAPVEQGGQPAPSAPEAAAAPAPAAPPTVPAVTPAAPVASDPAKAPASV
jgi:hypothetical protein